MVTSNSILPIITFTGTGGIGSFLVVITPGTWIDAATFTYQWRRNGVDIPGATSKTYLITPEDAGATVDCAVTGNP